MHDDDENPGPDRAANPEAYAEAICVGCTEKIVYDWAQGTWVHVDPTAPTGHSTHPLRTAEDWLPHFWQPEGECWRCHEHNVEVAFAHVPDSMYERLPEPAMTWSVPLCGDCLTLADVALTEAWWNPDGKAPGAYNAVAHEAARIALARVYRG